jgi:hypothetical protein
MRKHLDSITALAALSAALVAGGCQKEASSPPVPKTASVPVDVTTQTATPAPPGNSTPTPAKEGANAASTSSAETGKSGSQSTVGTSANGAPPETQQSAPEGNPPPKGGNVKK